MINVESRYDDTGSKIYANAARDHLLPTSYLLMRQELMRPPNLLIIGAQKSGTTWLHHALNKSKYLSGSRIKEINYWNKRRLGSFEGYCQNFQFRSGEEIYFYESTPHYFRMPKNNFNIAARIRQKLGDIPLILMLRNPVDRYLSALTHHMMKGRIGWLGEVTEINDCLGLISLGFYHQIYEVFANEFTSIHTFLYDDLVADKVALLNKIMSQLDLKNDIKSKHLDFIVNSKAEKIHSIENMPSLPYLSHAVKDELRSIYHKEVLGMQGVLKRDLTHWLEP